MTLTHNEVLTVETLEDLEALPVGTELNLATAHLFVKKAEGGHFNWSRGNLDGVFCTYADSMTRTPGSGWLPATITNADEVFSIGTVNGIRQPIVIGPKIRNVPKEGYHAWDPGGYIGLYQPDTFWISR
jgi:hypothetical protein